MTRMLHTKMLHVYKFNIMPGQAVRIFTAKKDRKRSWQEHFLYLVAVREAAGEAGTDHMVLNKIVQYASNDFS